MNINESFVFESGGDAVTSVSTQQESDTLHKHEYVRDTRRTLCDKHETPYKSLVCICKRCNKTHYTYKVCARHTAHVAPRARSRISGIPSWIMTLW
jgi:hypothetical protein